MWKRGSEGPKVGGAETNAWLHSKLQIQYLTVCDGGEDRGRSSPLLPSVAEPGRTWALKSALSRRLACTKILQAALMIPHLRMREPKSGKVHRLGGRITRLRHTHLNCTTHLLLKVSPCQFPKFWLLQMSFDVLPVTICCICLFVWNR